MPKLKSFPRTTFSTWQFFNLISNLKPNMTYNMIKIQIFLCQALYYNQIYNFILNHDYNFKLGTYSYFCPYLDCTTL
jgi:hypothetical protein